MRIGIDIDDTISKSSETFIEYALLYNQDNNVDYEPNLEVLDQEKAFGWNNQMRLDFSSKYLKEILKKSSPFENVSKVIRKLRSEGHTIVLITARTDDEVFGVYQLTIEWLDKNSIEYDKLIVNALDKSIHCLENDIDVFIDDNYQNCLSVLNTVGIPTFLFNSRYNCKYDNSLIKRIYTWNELYQIIKNMKVDDKYE